MQIDPAKIAAKGLTLEEIRGALVERHGIAWHEKTLGQLFCDGSARQIVAMLMAECGTGGVAFSFGASVTDVAHLDGLYGVSVGSRALIRSSTAGVRSPSGTV